MGEFDSDFQHQPSGNPGLHERNASPRGLDLRTVDER